MLIDLCNSLISGNKYHTEWKKLPFSVKFFIFSSNNQKSFPLSPRAAGQLILKKYTPESGTRWPIKACLESHGLNSFSYLKGLYRKNERGYRMKPENLSRWMIQIRLLSDVLMSLVIDIRLCQIYTKIHIHGILYQSCSIKEIIFNKYATNLKTTISHRSLRISYSLYRLYYVTRNFHRCQKQKSRDQYCNHPQPPPPAPAALSRYSSFPNMIRMCL